MFDCIYIFLNLKPKPRVIGGVYEYAIPWLGKGLLLSDGER